MSACQTNVYWDCKSCVVNGPGKCDPDGCPETTVYVEKDQLCAGKYHG